MQKAELIKEHKRLVRILRSGSQAARNREADLQEKELQDYLEPPEEKLKRGMKNAQDEEREKNL